MMLRRVILAATAVLALAACADRNYYSPGHPASAFSSELSKQYNMLASNEGEVLYDGSDAAYFRTKANKAANGVDVQPEEAEDWSVASEHVQELNKGYDMLQIALVPDNKKNSNPIWAARAQASYDCWIEQSQEKWAQGGGNGQCKANFYEAMCHVYGGSCKVIDRTSVFRVYFDTNSSMIDARGRATIANAVASYRGGDKNEVIVAGHADRVGSAAANQRLSKRRAEAVVAALKRSGISGAKMDEKYFGESQPLVATPDDVPNRNNRRVLIVVR